MALIVDTRAADRTLPEDEFSQWAADQSVFLSSVMGELADERKAVAAALESAGFHVRWFEGFGGTDDRPDVAYKTEVAGADIYVGVVADVYGALQPASGFSATHEEYLEARRTGKRVTFWVRADGSTREGHARTFVSEVYVFNTAGRFTDADSLVTGLLKRLRQIAAEDLSPWVKVGNVVFRAERIRDAGGQLEVRARVRDATVMQALRALAPDDRWGMNREMPVTYGDRSGLGRIETFEVETQSAANQTVVLGMHVNWSGGQRGARVSLGGINGLSAEEVTAAGIRAGYLHEPLPQQLGGLFGMADSTDPLAPLTELQLPESVVVPLGRLLVVEHLIGSGQATSVDEFVLGPADAGRRRLRLVYSEPRVYSNVEPGQREIEGSRSW